MSQRNGARSVDRAEPLFPIRVLRVAPGQKLVVRTLADRYSGCFTHFAKKRSYYCPGPDTCQFHREAVVWKGYTQVEEWQQAANMWVPWVLEITEAFDQELWDLFGAGQVWQLERAAAGAPKNVPKARAKLLEERDPTTFPAAFDMRPVLCNLYHVLELRLDKENPLPRRLKLAASKGAPPVDRTRADDKPPPVAEEVEAKYKQHRDQFRKDCANGIGGMPTN